MAGSAKIFLHLQNRSRMLKVKKYPVKSISSNIRFPINWPTVHIHPKGTANEGDILLVQALTNGARNQVENTNGRDDKIYPGDYFVGVLANRHSGTSESGDVPKEGIKIKSDTKLQLLSAGGVIGLASGAPKSMNSGLMQLKPIGLLKQKGQTLSLERMFGEWDKNLKPSAPIILVMGTSAEVGKTTTSAAITRSLITDGLKVAVTKFSGTGRMRDIRSLADAGAIPWLDFPDVGLATTYTSPKRFTPAIYTLFNLLNKSHPDVIVAEAGGDPIEANVSTFLADEKLMQYVKAAIIVAGDVMGMMGTIEYIRKFAPNLDILLTQPKGRNPVTTRERVQALLPGLPLFDSLNSSEVSKIAQLIKAKL